MLLCSACLKKLPPAGEPSYDFITSVFAYHDFRVRRLIRLLKYKNARHVAEVFAPPLAAALVEFLGEEDLFLGSKEILLVPIPLTRKRRAQRGYNQAELLANAVAKQISEVNIRVDTGLLKKIQETIPQADIKQRSERLLNLGECFWAPAARKVLRAAGFSRVYAFTVAH